MIHKVKQHATLCQLDCRRQRMSAAEVYGVDLLHSRPTDYSGVYCDIRRLRARADFLDFGQRIPSVDDELLKLESLSTALDISTKRKKVLT